MKSLAVTAMSASARRVAWVAAWTALVILSSVVIGCGGGGGGGAGAAAASPEPVSNKPQLRLVAGTIAGPGYADGVQARFNDPYGVAVDRDDNIYVADTGNHVIRKITPDRVVSTFAGMAGQSGSVDGPGSEARFVRPVAVAVDPAGNVYVADDTDYTVRKITPAGAVTTIAGSPGSGGFVDGPGAQARFLSPYAIAVDANGNVYVADRGNHSIRKISPSGMISTLAGAPSGTPGYTSLLVSPTGIAVDAAGNVFVAAYYAVRKLDPQGRISTVVAGGPDAQGNQTFTSPAGVALDAAGSIYVTEFGLPLLRRIAPDGQISTIGGLRYPCGPTEGKATGYFFPEGVAVRPNGNVLVSSREASVVCEVSPEGATTLVAGGGGRDPSGVKQVVDSNGVPRQLPQSGSRIAIDAQGNVFIAADRELFRLSPDNVLTLIGGWARDVAVDAAGNLYVAVYPGTHGIFLTNVLKITPAGVISSLNGTIANISDPDGKSGLYRFDGPLGVAVDRTGNVYVSEVSNVVVKITPAGIVSTLAGQRGTFGNADGVGAAAQFRSPQGLAVDPDGDVYVADTGNNVIRKITPDGAVSTLADGTGAAARFGSPNAVALDSARNVWVADAGNFTVRRISPNGAVSTIAGKAGALGIELGDLPAGLGYLGGIATSASGVYILSGQALLRID